VEPALISMVAAAKTIRRRLEATHARPLRM
jgi:hypothetical protein